MTHHFAWFEFTEWRPCSCSAPVRVEVLLEGDFERVRTCDECGATWSEE